MTKSIKLKNNTFIDSTGVIHNRTPLNTLLDNIGSLEEYSTTERVIGTWIDGKTLYRKTFTGTLTNNGTKQFDSGLTNENICKMYGVARETSTGYTLAIPHVNISSLSSGIRIDYVKSTHKLNVSNGGNLSGYTAYVTLEYTKTTD